MHRLAVLSLAACFVAVFAAPVASAQNAGRALVRGDARAAAASLTEQLTDAVARSRTRLAVTDAELLEAQLTEDLAEAAALSQDRRLHWRADLTVSWRQNTAPDEPGGACGGYVDVGDARVTATSTSRAAAPGLARLSCTLATQSEDAFGWVGFTAISPGEGALTVEFSVTSDDAAVRQAAAAPLSRAMQRIFAALRPADAAPQRRPSTRRRVPGDET